MVTTTCIFGKLVGFVRAPETNQPTNEADLPWDGSDSRKSTNNTADWISFFDAVFYSIGGIFPADIYSFWGHFLKYAGMTQLRTLDATL